MSGIIWKHEAPRRCRIRRALFGASPSAILGRCTLGLRHGCRACKGCDHNVAEAWQEGFAEGLGEEKESALEKLKEMDPPAVSLEFSAADLVALPDGTDLNGLVAPGVYILDHDGKYYPHTFDGEKWVRIPDKLTPVEEAEPPEPEKPPDYVEAFQRAVQVYAEAARALHEWLANFAQALAPVAEHFREILREALENAARTPPKVNKRPDYSQKAKADTRGKIKRIRKQRSREKK